VRVAVCHHCEGELPSVLVAVGGGRRGPNMAPGEGGMLQLSWWITPVMNSKIVEVEVECMLDTRPDFALVEAPFSPRRNPHSPTHPDVCWPQVCVLDHRTYPPGWKVEWLRHEER
jgi:hypothetical protein